MQNSFRTISCLVVSVCLAATGMNGHTFDNPVDNSLAILPMLTLRPGETKTLLLASEKPMMSRSEGLGIYKAVPKEEPNPQKQWEENGVIITVPGMMTAAKASDWSPRYQTVTDVDLYPFEITVAVDKNAKSQVLKLFAVNSTCGGTASTQFCVLVSE